MTLGEKIKEIRLKSNLTIQDLSKKSGLSVVSICHYENGKTKPTLTNLHKLSVALECDFDDLYKLFN